MTKFVCLQARVGTPRISSNYFGPFDKLFAADAFVERVREEYGKMRFAPGMTISIADKVSEEHEIHKPEGFGGFMEFFWGGRDLTIMIVSPDTWNFLN